MTFRRPTPAQAKATERNFRIFRLRGLRVQLELLTGHRRRVAQGMVDAELRAMGATIQPKGHRDEL